MRSTPVHLLRGAPVNLQRVAVSTAFFCQGFAFAALITRIPAIQDQFNFSEGGLAMILAGVPILAGVGSVLAGLLAVRFHSAVVLRVCALIVAGGLVAVGAATTSGSFPGLLVALALMGFGLGSVDATMNMQGIGVQAQVGRSVMASFYAWWSLATILGALAASVAAATSLSLLAFFAIVAVVLIPVGLLASTRFVRSHEADAAAPDPLAASAAVPWRPLLVFGFAVVLAFIIDSSVSNWSALDLTDVLGATESVAALAYAAYALFMLIGRMFADHLVGRKGAQWLITAGGLLAAVGLVVVAAAPSAIVAIVGFAIVGLGISPVLPMAFVAASHHDPRHTGIAVARVNVGNYIGFVIGAPLVGVIGEFSSLRVGFAVLVAAALGIAVMARSFD
ncbi:MAG: MFS transporter [Actinobacteria bacterium]|nr:MAG: MFS transporter [Actinomycetota bacterium]